jgi:hypothetical protein
MSGRVTSIPPVPMTTTRVRELVEGRRDQYCGADFSAIVVPTTAGMRLTRGVLRFVFQNDQSRDERLDYGNLVLVRKRVAIDQALAIVEGINTGTEALSGLDFGVEPFQSIFLSPRPSNHTPAPLGERPSGEWPSFEAWLRPNDQLYYREPAGPLVRPGLPTLADPHEYATDWIKLDRQRQAHEQNVVVVLAPDHRLRLGPVTFGEEGVSVAVTFDPGQQHPAVSFRAAWIMGQPHRESRIQLKLDGNALRLSYPTEWSTLQVYATAEPSGELLDWVQIHRTYGYNDADIIVVQSSTRRFEELLEEWETQTVEFKASVNPTNAHDFIQSVVAFSNTDGGTIFVGVEDSGTVVGVRNPETVEQTIANFIEEFCEPPVTPIYDVVEAGSLKVLAVSVPVGSDRPYVHRPTGAIYVRRGSHDRPARRSEILALMGRG